MAKMTDRTAKATKSTFGSSSVPCSRVCSLCPPRRPSAVNQSLWRANNGRGRHQPTPKSGYIPALSVGSDWWPFTSSWHTSLVTNSESWRGRRGGEEEEEEGGSFERISSTNHTADVDSGLREDEKLTRAQHSQRCEISAKRTANLRSSHRRRGTIAAISATVHEARSRTSSGMPSTKASCKGSTARESRGDSPQLPVPPGVYR